ncbi:MAG TPA: glycosyltransferase family 4 protein, partial [Candidatus Binataceae bacterium]
ITCGYSVAEAQLARGYSAKPHRVIPLGVDLKKFFPDTAARNATLLHLNWDDSGPPIVGCLGRFVEEKGHRLLMSVLGRLRRPWRALFVGSGPLESELRSWAATRNGQVRIVTGVTHEQVPAYLNAMDVMCAPSQTTSRWREQFGRMLVEAFACGVPVVASDSGEIPYVVDDAGVIVGEKNEDGWVQALDRLLEDASYRRTLTALGLERARADYAWPVVARQHLDFFDELLDTSGALKQNDQPA